MEPVRPQAAPGQRPVPHVSDGRRPVRSHRDSRQPRQDQDSQHRPGPHLRHPDMSAFISLDLTFIVSNNYYLLSVRFSCRTYLLYLTPQPCRWSRWPRADRRFGPDRVDAWSSFARSPTARLERQGSTAAHNKHTTPFILRLCEQKQKICFK